MIALLRFHLASGARVAMAAAVPLAGAVTVVIGLQPSPARTVEQIVSAIAGARPSFAGIAALGALAFALALWAAPRVTLGSDGWIRHLPVSRIHHTIALIAATACAEAPLVAAGVGCAALTSWRTGILAWRGFLLPPFVALATAALVIGLRPGRRHGARRSWLPASIPLDARIAWRAIGARVLSGWIAGAIPLGAAFLFVSNNVLPAHLARGGVRFGGALAATLALAPCAEALAVRRPSWPWARSLPWTASRRVVGDSVVLCTLCAPVIVGTAALDLRAAGPVLALMPLLALRAAAAMRRRGESRSAASGPILIEGTFASGLLALVPWLGLMALAAVPFALRFAIESERALKVTRWSALHHLAAGDTLSWTK